MRAADQASFEEWARASQQRLVRTAYLLTGDFQRAEDLVQEALVKAATRWTTLREGSPDAWVRTVIYRDHVSWWRRTRRERVGDRTVDAVVPSAGEGAVMLRAALTRLTPSQRAVVVLRYVEDLSTARTAEVLGVSEGTVKRQASVALQRLRRVAPELEELVEERR
jgi:RNA polymerase sigma-70 factor (sigma-E family)